MDLIKSYCEKFTQVIYQHLQQEIDNSEDIGEILKQFISIFETLTTSLYVEDYVFCRELCQLCHTLFLYAAKMVLSTDWFNLEVNDEHRIQFLASADKLHYVIRDLYGLNYFLVLIHLADNPWSHPILLRILIGDHTVEPKQVEDYLCHQMNGIIEMRIQLLYESGATEMVVNLCNRCLAHKRYRDNDYIRMFLLISLYSEKNEDLLHSECWKVPCHQAVRLIQGFLQQKNPKYTGLCAKLSQIFLLQDWLKPKDYCCTKTLLMLWLRLQFEEDMRDCRGDQFVFGIRKVAEAARNGTQIIWLIDAICKLITCYSDSQVLQDALTAVLLEMNTRKLKHKVKRLRTKNYRNNSRSTDVKLLVQPGGSNIDSCMLMNGAISGSMQQPADYLMSHILGQYTPSKYVRIGTGTQKANATKRQCDDVEGGASSKSSTSKFGGKMAVSAEGKSAIKRKHGLNTEAQLITLETEHGYCIPSVPESSCAKIRKRPETTHVLCKKTMVEDRFKSGTLLTTNKPNILRHSSCNISLQNKPGHTPVHAVTTSINSTACTSSNKPSAMRLATFMIGNNNNILKQSVVGTQVLKQKSGHTINFRKAACISSRGNLLQKTDATPVACLVMKNKPSVTKQLVPNFVLLNTKLRQIQKKDLVMTTRTSLVSSPQNPSVITSSVVTGLTKDTNLLTTCMPIRPESTCVPNQNLKVEPFPGQKNGNCVSYTRSVSTIANPVRRQKITVIQTRAKTPFLRGAVQQTFRAQGNRTALRFNSPVTSDPGTTMPQLPSPTVVSLSNSAARYKMFSIPEISTDETVNNLDLLANVAEATAEATNIPNGPLLKQFLMMKDLTAVAAPALLNVSTDRKNVASSVYGSSNGSIFNKKISNSTAIINISDHYKPETIITNGIVRTKPSDVNVKKPLPSNEPVSRYNAVPLNTLVQQCSGASAVTAISARMALQTAAAAISTSVTK